MLLWNLLAEETNANPLGNMVYLIVLLIPVIFLIVWLLFSNKKGKQRQQEYIEQLAALKPGHKVKTIGGICGVVVEVCDDDNTVIIETGTEASGKSYLKMDKESIMQTDAKGPTQIAREEAEERRKAEKESKSESFPAEEEEKSEEKEEGKE